jgi:DNA mismatch repair protein MLH3
VGEDSLPATGSRRSPRKSERKPIYCLNISLPLESVDNCIEPAKNAVQLQVSTSAILTHGVDSSDKNEFAMIKAVSEVIRDFLTKHRYLVLAKERVADGREDSESPIPHKRRKLTRSPVDPLEPEETEGSMAFLEGNGGTSHNTCIVYPGEVNAYW